MGHLFGRVVLLKNETDRVIELKESRRSAPHGLYSYTIRLDPFHEKKIGATMFHRRTKLAARPTVIRIFVDGVDLFDKVLTPQNFIDYFRISFRAGEDEKVIVTGVRATRSDQFRSTRLVGSLLSGLRFLIGNDEHGSQEEDIV
ncbi:uncharacterized protein LOC116133135 isoform X1 [Pistacia vera]|uniref:uncharacterized protein LOC116133135 isoform X1 n=1 Tax=Pistacia vera TaxID=55513 RepID=UPI001262C47A|nr:uncharacterized protein LOC116133135 isoform X1 [Pistacia vera]